MAGHSKWSTIKHKKAKEDAKRGKAFTKIIKEITVTARQGGGDPDANPRLRTLVEKAKSINMPQDNIVRAIKKGTGELPGVTYERITYEGYGPHGIAVIVEVLTDNKNRSVANLRYTFSAKGGSLAESGAVSWSFEKLGVIKASSNKLSEDELLEQLLDYDINDITLDEGIYFISCNPKSLDTVKKAVEALGLSIESADLEWVPKNTSDLEGKQADQAYAFLSALEDLEDVQNVYTNLA